MVAENNPGFSINRLKNPEFRMKLLLSSSILSLSEAINAISIPEKKTDARSEPMMIRIKFIINMQFY
jgi:hypothetical protein